MKFIGVHFKVKWSKAGRCQVLPLACIRDLKRNGDYGAMSFET
jgi:hypothetical protein